MDVAITSTSSRAALVSRLLLGEDPDDPDSLASKVAKERDPRPAPGNDGDSTTGARPPARAHPAHPLATTGEISISERISFELSLGRTETRGGQTVSSAASSPDVERSPDIRVGPGGHQPAAETGPRIIDLDRDGVETLGVEELKKYDSDGDGSLTPADIAWPRLRLLDMSRTSTPDDAGISVTHLARRAYGGETSDGDHLTVSFSDGRTTDAVGAWLKGVI